MSPPRRGPRCFAFARVNSGRGQADDAASLSRGCGLSVASGLQLPHLTPTLYRCPCLRTRHGRLPGSTCSLMTSSCLVATCRMQHVGQVRVQERLPRPVRHAGPVIPPFHTRIPPFDTTLLPFDTTLPPLHSSALLSAAPTPAAAGSPWHSHPTSLVLPRVNLAATWPHNRSPLGPHPASLPSAAHPPACSCPMPPRHWALTSSLVLARVIRCNLAA